jgi:class 3 adenylate cyclase/tetratricopeptide (TPR) repeat protein
MSCATPLAAAPPSREMRKTVTVVFTDVTGSTSLGERLDPESLRRVMGQYFEEMRAVLERHGGTVEKFIGDAVMAVFGIPRLHEDDALRAVRAAWDMREALDALNARLESELGITIATRTGVNTGEVVTGDPGAGQTLVTGDAVNVAARLEQSAGPGEILLGPTTHRLVRDAAEADSVDPLTLKGKEEPVAAVRLRALVAGAAGTARRLDSPMVGRDREMDLLRWAFDRGAGERTCHLMTVLGAAGVGKSRLVEEFLGLHASDATVLRGRCLPYGEGITFWPVAEAAKQAAAITEDDQAETARAKLAALVEGEEHAELISGRVAQVIGLARDSAVAEETFWAIRSLFEVLARRQPLVLVFEDIHWAEPTLLDLIEHIADWSRDAPILLLCLARQELLELRPGWGGGKVNASTVLLEPLSDSDCERLIGNLLGRAGLPPEAVRRIEEAAEGNPLFVEEMVAMLIDDGLLRRTDGDWAAAGDLSNVAVPPTIQALLAARLDRLAREERTVLEGASVVGRVFYRGAVTALATDDVRPTVPGRLATLVRRELIRPDRSDFAGEDAYRFRHMLIRDSAYESMPKEGRADLHERFADWLERAVGERAREYEEILGHHLEQAYRYRHELGLLTDGAAGLGARAARYLVSAGRRAEARGDLAGALNLLSRATELLPKDDPERVGILPTVARLLLSAGEMSEATEMAQRAIQEAGQVGDLAAQLQAEMVAVLAEVNTHPEMPFERSRGEAELILARAEDLGDPATLARAWYLVGELRFWSGDAAAAHQAATRGYELARSAGLQALLHDLDNLEFEFAVYGPFPVDEAIRLWEPLLEAPRSPTGALFANGVMSVMYAMKGEPELARAHNDRVLELTQDFGMKLNLAAAHPVALIHLLNGDPAAAEAALRPGLITLREMGESGFLSSSAAFVAEAVYRQGRYDEAEELSRMTEELASADDVASQSSWRSLRAKVLAQRGQFDQAVRLAQEAVDIVEPTDHSQQKGDMLMDLAEVLRLAGRRHDALAAAQHALAVFEAKGNVVSAARARREAEELAGS